jgi:hypothetical protein
MIPTSFTVNVNTYNRKVLVTPRNGSNVVDIETTRFITDLASSVLTIISSLDISFKALIIGNILTCNINNKIS